MPLYVLHELFYGLPGKHELPDVDKMVLLDWRGRVIVGSEKTTEIYGADAPVSKVPGLHAGTRFSWLWSEKPLWLWIKDQEEL